MSRLAFVLLLVGVSGCDMLSMCGDRLMSEVPSPDGKVVARVWERDCGATVPQTPTFVDVRSSFVRTPQGASDSTTVLIHLGPARTTKLRWLDDHSLEIDAKAFGDEVRKRELTKRVGFRTINTEIVGVGNV